MMTEDPAVALTEQLLAHVSAAADPNALLAQPDVAARGMWLCPCYQDDDAPTWLLWETPEGELGWCRLPHGVHEDQLVHARQWIGGHTDVAGVLSWIRGSAPDPWIEDADRTSHAADLRVFARLVRAGT